MRIAKSTDFIGWAARQSDYSGIANSEAWPSVAEFTRPTR
jgi:hypothetical protein